MMELSAEIITKVTEINQDVKYILKILDDIKNDVSNNKSVLDKHDNYIKLMDAKIKTLEEKQKDVIVLKPDIKTVIAIVGLLAALIALKII